MGTESSLVPQRHPLKLVFSSQFHFSCLRVHINGINCVYFFMSCVFPSACLKNALIFKIDFRERGMEREREREREREKHWLERETLAVSHRSPNQELNPQPLNLLVYRSRLQPADPPGQGSLMFSYVSVLLSFFSTFVSFFLLFLFLSPLKSIPLGY